MQNFKGYCPKCKQASMANASFCHLCGQCFINDSDEIDFKYFTPQAQDLKKILHHINQIFVIWMISFVAFALSGLAYALKQSISPLMVSGVIFFYLWIFLTAKMDELASHFSRKYSHMVYFSLLLPVVGTVLCYQKISRLIQDNNNES